VEEEIEGGKMKVPKLTKEQEEWLESKISKFDKIYVGVHGSWLYGLAHDKSDIDIKVIYMPSKTDLILGNAVKTYNYKNEDLEIEVEVKSLSSFLNSAASVDTNCVDLLHSPDEMCLDKTILWDNIRKHRSNLYAKNMKGLVGYVKTHSKKYTNKIDRLEEMKKVLKHCFSVDYDLVRKYLTVRDLAEGVSWDTFKYVNKVTLVQDHEQQYLEVCGKKYIYTWSVDQLAKAMEHEISRYGKRSNEGLDKGLDTKSLSHAIRVLCEMKELVTERNITFPLKDKDFILKVKTGEVNDLETVLNKIDILYDEVMFELDNSGLPENVDLSPMYKCVEEYYFGK